MQATITKGVRCRKSGIVSSGIANDVVIDLDIAIDIETDVLVVTSPSRYGANGMQWVLESGGMHIYANGAVTLFSRFQYQIWSYEGVLAAPIIRGRAGPYSMTMTPTNYDITLSTPVPNVDKAVGGWASWGQPWKQPSIGNGLQYEEIVHPFPNVNTMRFSGSVAAAFGGIYLCYEVFPMKKAIG